MNFFERQHEVRRASARLVWLFALAVVLIVAVVDVAVWLAFGLSRLPFSVAAQSLAIASAIVVVLIGVTSWIRTLLLRRGGGGKVAASLGGVAVPENTTDPNLRRLRNVVEEIAIASAMPVPELYVLPHEPGINAFAAGWTPGDAAVAVTQGALDRLNRDELQGVIAHEFSHIVNGDMRLNIRLIGVLAGIVGLAVVGRMMLGGGRGARRNNGGAPLVVVALAVLVIGYLGVLAGRLIKAAVSRQREYLADASAVQFTRQTAGLAGALKKIGGLQAGSSLRSAKAEDVSHMLFGEGRRLSAMFATHPPLARRIQLLDPAFDPAELDRLRTQWAAEPPAGLREDEALGLTSRQPAQIRQATTLPAHPGAVAATVGEPSAGSFAHAGGLLRDIPDAVQAKARHPGTVVPVVLGLLFSPRADVRAHQHRLLAARGGQTLADAAWQEGAALAQLDPALRLPLTEVAFPALRHRPPQELQALLAAITELTRADGHVGVFEYCLSTLLHRDLFEAMHRRPPWTTSRTTLRRSAPAVATVLAVLAAAGTADPRAAEAAFRAGLARALPGAALPFQPPPQGPVALDPVWPALDGLAGPEKAVLVEALATVAGHNGVLTVEESELLRTVCALLHCPLPPLAGTVSSDARSV
ncbi:M48 family metallopeptidase [Prauserella muralis]|uniref:Peptidase M48 n=1 Tax=Prauserella muralis TaxID=588067 RepID=A0A2V4B2X4_9PSEU|nr:M48 family metallopeptidase [Prauserella muralis]PXY27748.1 peptidase M48 [Prauserella muralis]TWE22500.1 Zn-dependent protease with chaperone function [Prauserella muralis]